MYGYVWQCMVMYGYVGLCMAMKGYVWLCMAKHHEQSVLVRTLFSCTIIVNLNS